MERFLIGQEKMQIFEESPLFSSHKHPLQKANNERNGEKKKSETELTASVLKKDQKHTRD